jgi:eukaryotic-like serine/threonine-protein kinase
MDAGADAVGVERVPAEMPVYSGSDSGSDADGSDLRGKSDGEDVVNEEAGVPGIPSWREARQRRRRLRAAAAAVVGVAALGGLWMLGRGRFERPLVDRDRPLMIAAVENRTGDLAFDGTIAQGLEMLLAESPNLTVLGEDAYRAAWRSLGENAAGTTSGAGAAVLARQAAQTAGAKAYLYGTVRKAAGGGYTIAVEVLDAASNRELANVERTAGNVEAIPGAIDDVAARLAAALHVNLESLDGGAQSADLGGSPVRLDVPLAREATGSVAALHWYSVGMTSVLDGRMDAAMKAFQAAVGLDPGFVQAQMRLAWVYRARHEELASADVARLAEASSRLPARSISTRTALLVEYCYSQNTIDDTERAAAAMRRLKLLYPHDPEILGMASAGAL